MRDADGRYYKVLDRVVVEPAWHDGSSIGTTHLVGRPTRGTLMETEGPSRFRIRLDNGPIIYAMPEYVRHLDAIEAVSEADR